MRRILRMTSAGDSGLSLVELLVTMMLTTLIMSITFTVTMTVQRQTADNQARQRSISQAELAMARIDRQVRSGNVLFNPDAEDVVAGASVCPDPVKNDNSGSCMRVYTQANGNQKCVQWQVLGGALRTRAWSPAWRTDGQVTGWATVANSLANDPAASPPFRLTGSGAVTAYSARVVDIKLLVRDPKDVGRTTEVQTSLSGRNTIYGYDQSVCDDLP